MLTEDLLNKYGHYKDAFVIIKATFIIGARRWCFVLCNVWTRLPPELRLTHLPATLRPRARRWTPSLPMTGKTMVGQDHHRYTSAFFRSWAKHCNNHLHLGRQSRTLHRGFTASPHHTSDGVQDVLRIVKSWRGEAACVDARPSWRIQLTLAP